MKWWKFLHLDENFAFLLETYLPVRVNVNIHTFLANNILGGLFMLSILISFQFDFSNISSPFLHFSFCYFLIIFYILSLTLVQVWSGMQIRKENWFIFIMSSKICDNLNAFTLSLPIILSIYYWISNVFLSMHPFHHILNCNFPPPRLSNWKSVL